MKKYELTNESISWFGTTLFKIRALKNFGNVKKEDLGGFIEKESNLSQDGNCWIFESAKVYGDAKVYGYGKIPSLYGRSYFLYQIWVSSLRN